MLSRYYVRCLRSQMKISRRKLQLLIQESILKENFGLDLKVTKEGNLSIRNFQPPLAYKISSKNIPLRIVSIENIDAGFKIVIKPPYIPFVSDGENKEGIISGEKLDRLRSNISQKLSSFSMTTKKGDNITFEII